MLYVNYISIKKSKQNKVNIFLFCQKCSVSSKGKSLFWWGPVSTVALQSPGKYRGKKSAWAGNWLSDLSVLLFPPSLLRNTLKLSVGTLSMLRKD